MHEVKKGKWGWTFPYTVTYYRKIALNTSGTRCWKTRRKLMPSNCSITIDLFHKMEGSTFSGSPVSWPIRQLIYYTHQSMHYLLYQALQRVYTTTLRVWESDSRIILNKSWNQIRDLSTVLQITVCWLVLRRKHHWQSWESNLNCQTIWLNMNPKKVTHYLQCLVLLEFSALHQGRALLRQNVGQKLLYYSCL